MSDSDDLLKEFLAEGAEILERINEALDTLAENPSALDALDRMFRDIHTMKGTAGVFGVPEATEIADQMETCLSSVKKTREPVSREQTQNMRELAAAIETVLSNYRNKTEPAASQAAPLASGAAAQIGQTTDDFLRIPVRRVNEVNNLISETFLVRNQLLYLVERLKGGKIDEKEFVHEWELLDSSMRRGLRDLGNAAMSMRMMSVKGVFTRMARVIESYVAQGGKKIKFATTGENTELDKKVLDVLGEPLIHLIRNAMDHGIEPVEERHASGKPSTGTITLEAKTEGSQVILKVSDDGKGIDPQKVLTSARKKGLDVSGVTDDKAAIHLIFLPGFSTAEKVTEVSGRGVGMDAVKTTVAELGGEVSIDTAVGRGTVFTIKLPMSMALTSVTIVDINGILYGIPSYEVIQTRKLTARELKVNQQRNYVQHDGEFVACMDLRPCLTRASGHEENFREISVLFFEDKGRIRAGQVSRFVENTELVIKPIPPTFPKIPFATGVSVLPTGEPIFILSLWRYEECRGSIMPFTETGGGRHVS